MSADKEGFAARWARRKREGAEEPVVEDPILPPAQKVADAGDETIAPSVIPGTESGQSTAHVPSVRAPDPSTDALENTALEADQREEAPVLTDDDMPPLESLNGESDVSAFFSKGVSSALRQAALRQIFAAPRYNIRDGLNDYDGDYTVFEPLGDTVTSDMKFHAARKEAARLAALEEEKERKALARSESEQQESEAARPEVTDEEADRLDDASKDEMEHVAESEDDVTAPSADDVHDTQAASSDSTDISDAAANPDETVST